MKVIFLVVLGIVSALVTCGMHIRIHEPGGIIDSVDCCMECVQLEVTTNVAGNCIVEHVDPHIVLSFEVYKDGRYDVYYGNKNGASQMRSGEMDKKLWDLMKAMSWRDISPFWCRFWCCRRRMEKVVATNSVMCISQEDLEVLHHAVSNAIPNGRRMPIDSVNPLVWKFLSSADANQFWKKEERMR